MTFRPIKNGLRELSNAGHSAKRFDTLYDRLSSAEKSALWRAIIEKRLP